MRLLGLVALLLATVVAGHPASAATVWAVDAASQSIVAFDAATGAPTASVPTPDLASGGPDGLGASGSSLYFVNASGSNVIFEVDSATGATLNSFPAPLMAGGTDGLAVSDGVLYTLDAAADTIFKADPATGSVLGSCRTGVSAVGGLAGERGRLFALAGLVSIVELDPETCAVVGGPFSAPAGDEFLFGLAFDGERLYAGSWLGRTVYVMDPDTGAVLSSFPAGFVPSALASTALVSPAPPPSVEADVDVRPGSCSNPFNVKSRGVLPVVVYGSPDLDVSRIDPDSVTLEGVAPLRSRVADIGSPEDCSTLVTDGRDDLALKFDIRALVEALASAGAPLFHGARFEVTIAGELEDGTPFSGIDTLRVVSRPFETAPGARGKKRS